MKIILSIIEHEVHRLQKNTQLSDLTIFREIYSNQRVSDGVMAVSFSVYQSNIKWAMRKLQLSYVLHVFQFVVDVGCLIHDVDFALLALEVLHGQRVGEGAHEEGANRVHRGDFVGQQSSLRLIAVD